MTRFLVHFKPNHFSSINNVSILTCQMQPNPPFDTPSFVQIGYQHALGNVNTLESGIHLSRVDYNKAGKGRSRQLEYGHNIAASKGHS